MNNKLKRVCSILFVCMFIFTCLYVSCNILLHYEHHHSHECTTCNIVESLMIPSYHLANVCLFIAMSFAVVSYINKEYRITYKQDKTLIGSHVEFDN